MNWYERTELLFGAEAIERLKNSHVAIFGIGGVGSFAAESVARAGVGRITLIDGDVVSESNINRQLVALRSTIGRNKAAVMRERILDINPDAEVTAVEEFYTRENRDMFDFSAFDYVADAIDMVTSKLFLIEYCADCGTPIISAMGAGNRTDPSAFVVRDIFKTEGDPLSRVMRRELRDRGIKKLNVVFSPELPKIRPNMGDKIVGSVSYVPSSAGLVMAGKIVSDLIGGADE